MCIYRIPITKQIYCADDATGNNVPIPAGLFDQKVVKAKLKVSDRSQIECYRDKECLSDRYGDGGYRGYWEYRGISGDAEGY